MNLKYIGPGVYRGDGLTVQEGDTVEVSEEKARQLVTDFPDRWEELGPERLADLPANTEDEATVKLKRTGPGTYRGDGLEIHKGETVEVSEEKAEQLLRDFPKHWKRARKFFEPTKDKVKKPERNK